MANKILIHLRFKRGKHTSKIHSLRVKIHHDDFDTFSTLLALLWGESTGYQFLKGPVTQNFDILFDVCLNKWLNKQWNCWWFEMPLQWHNNERDGISNHWRLDCLLNRLFRCRSKKTSKLRVTGNSPHKRPVTRKIFQFNDVIMPRCSCDITVIQMI